jgi:hypothetical protein
MRENSSRHFANVSTDAATCAGSHVPAACIAVKTSNAAISTSIKSGSPHAVSQPMTGQCGSLLQPRRCILRAKSSASIRHQPVSLAAVFRAWFASGIDTSDILATQARICRFLRTRYLPVRPVRHSKEIPVV